jgi:hypothetical protein
MVTPILPLAAAQILKSGERTALDFDEAWFRN